MGQENTVKNSAMSAIGIEPIINSALELEVRNPANKMNNPSQPYITESMIHSSMPYAEPMMF